MAYDEKFTIDEAGKTMIDFPDAGHLKPPMASPKNEIQKNNLESQHHKYGAI
jgi:hypothetical protein